MKESIIYLIESESENTRLDFKLEQYPIEKSDFKKGEFLKDMCAFANLQSKEDKFIIIGVEEKNGVAIGLKSIDNLHDQASYQQFLNQYIEPEINFEYKEIIHQEKRLAYFRLYNNNKRPYLFKKEYRDIQQKGFQYRIGTGFVRTGTSTRELKRDDFERIYSDRLGPIDRSEDICFKIKLGSFQDSSLRHAGYKHLQIDVTNVSNLSIDLDVEARVYNKNDIDAFCTQNVQRKLNEEKRNNSMFSYTPYLDKMIPPHLFLDRNVKFEQESNYSLFEITPRKGTHTALRVKQKGTETDIFNGQIALIFAKPTEVKVDLIVRCNDFLEGPKTFSYCFDEEDVNHVLNPWDL